MDLDWWTATIDQARHTDAFDDSALTSGTAWADFCEQLKSAGEQIQRADVPGSPLDRATGYRHLMGLVWTGIHQAMVFSDPMNPTFSQVARMDVFKWGLDCPDAAYRSASIIGSETYKIVGRLGTAHYLSFQVNEGMANHGNLRGDELQLEADGSFVLWVGPDKQPGNWIASPPNADFLIVRQFFYDWDEETQSVLHIERVPAEGTPSPNIDNLNEATPSRVGQQLGSIATWVNASAKFWIDVEAIGQMSDQNRFQAATAKPESGGAIENLNGWGHFDLGPDEALIIDVQPATALYWSVHLGNFWWESLDYCYRHTSLNGFQAAIDDDGRFRAVVAHKDPGVANWLDTCGHSRGPMLFRWIVADHAPEPTCTVVPFSEVRSLLPDSTREVSSLRRREIIAKRRERSSAPLHALIPRPMHQNTKTELSHLDRLEAESIHIMRETVAECERPAMLYSIGKDSSVMLHLARKAFHPTTPPFPLLHVDTTWKFQAMYRMRTQIASESGMELLVYQNPECIRLGINPFEHGSAVHTDMWKTQGLKQALDHYRFDAAFGGARRDEEKSRAKERIFSIRSAQHRWDPKRQRPELWRTYNVRRTAGESLRVFPLSNWTELDVWQYIYREKIAIVPLYLAAMRPVVMRNGVWIMVDDDRLPLQAGEVPQQRSVRFRTLGCYPLTGAMESEAATLRSVIQEMLLATTSEREGRVIDFDAAGSMEMKKQEGYF